MPLCPLQARRCGGCTRLSVPYERQLRYKQKQLEGLFEHVMPITGMEEPYRYRNKIIAAVAHDREGLLTGQYVYGTHYVLRQADCLLENADAVRIVNSTREILNAARVPAWDEQRRTGLLRFVQVRYAARTRQALVTLVTSSPEFPDGETLAEKLCEREPEVRGVIQNVNPRTGSAVLGFEEHILHGSPTIEDEMCGLRVRLSSRAFYQVNTLQAEKLYMKAIELAGLSGHEKVLDAYCGLGLIGMLAAGKGKEVVGIEQNPSAIRLAKRIAQANGIGNIRFERGDAARILKDKRLSADLVLLDPPREGLSPAMTETLCTMLPERIVYISCNPVTQARDIHALLSSGYRVSPVWPFDLFPHTEHVETVVQLSKGNISSEKIRVEFDLEDMDMSRFQQGATYEEIQEWVQEKYGFHVTHLNIAKTKRKCGIIERINYNLPKSENSKSPVTPKDKEDAIIDAFRHFQMI